MRDSALGAIGSRLQKAQGVEIDKIELLNDLFTYANGQVNIALHRIWAENSGEAIDWYCDLAAQVEGVTVDLEWDMPQEPTRYHHWPIAHGTNDGTDLVGGIQTAVVGKIMGALDARLVSNGGEIRYQTPLVSLAKEGDRVVGAYAKNDQGDYVRINASKGVIVATGGYVNNAEMYQALQGQINKSVSGWCHIPCHRGWYQGVSLGGGSVRQCEDDDDLRSWVGETRLGIRRARFRWLLLCPGQPTIS